MRGKKSRKLTIRDFIKSDDPISSTITKKVIEFGEELSELDFKESFNPESKLDWAKLSKHIIAMANTRGGYIVLGVNDNYRPVGMPKEILNSIDTATLHSKVNRFIEPEIEEIRYRVVKHKNKSFGIIFVPKSSDRTHVIKRNYDCQGEEKNKVTHVLSKGHILVRHGAKSEPLNANDLRRIINERLKEYRDFLTAGIRKISSAKIPSEVIIAPKEKSALKVRITKDKNAPQVRGIIDREKCTSLQEELYCSIKTWKTSPESLLTISQLAKIYAERENLEIDEELAEFIFRSSLHRWMPSFYWASKLSKRNLKKVLQSVIERDEHPSARECLKVLLLINKKFAEDKLKYVKNHTHLNGAKNDAIRFLRFLNRKDRYKQIFPTGHYLTYYLENKEKKVKIDDILEGRIDAKELLDKVSTEFARNTRNSANKWPLKILDLLVYGLNFIE